MRMVVRNYSLVWLGFRLGRRVCFLLRGLSLDTQRGRNRLLRRMVCKFHRSIIIDHPSKWWKWYLWLYLRLEIWRVLGRSLEFTRRSQFVSLSKRVATYNWAIPSGLRSSLRSFNDFCNLSEVLYGSWASRFRLSRSCLPLSRSSRVENMDVEERRPIVGKGMISESEAVSSRALW